LHSRAARTHRAKRTRRRIQLANAPPPIVPIDRCHCDWAPAKLNHDAFGCRELADFAHLAEQLDKTRWKLTKDASVYLEEQSGRHYKAFAFGAEHLWVAKADVQQVLPTPPNEGVLIGWESFYTRPSDTEWARRMKQQLQNTTPYSSCYHQVPKFHAHGLSSSWAFPRGSEQRIMTDDFVNAIRLPIFEFGDRVLIADQLDRLRAALQKLADPQWGEYRSDEQTVKWVVKVARAALKE
jgi:hypothetical protein